MARAIESAKQSNTFWREIRDLKFTAPLLFHTIIMLFLIEVFAVFIAPEIIPDYKYLYFYLGEKARKNTEEFLHNQTKYLLRDEITGWSNQFNYEHGKWKIDAHGSRSTHFFTTIPSKPIRVLFLGSSLVNGGTQISNNETISALLEDSRIEAINFGTMMYSLDQMYLAYKKKLYKYNSNIIVIGLPGDPLNGLTNQYIPFLFEQEKNMPYLKPRFILRSGKLTLLPMPSKQVYEDLFSNSKLIRQLKKTGGYYNKFEAFKRYGFTPISNCIWFIYKKIISLKNNVVGDFSNMPLLKSLMRQMVAEADKNNATVIFMFLPSKKIIDPGWRKLFPDHYGQLLKELKREGFDIFDAGQTLKESGINPSELYYSADYVHYSVMGNRVISAALKGKIENIFRNQKSSTMIKSIEEHARIFFVAKE